MRFIFRPFWLIPMAWIILSSGVGWASPIDYKSVPDEALAWGTGLVIVLLLAQAVLALTALVRYYKRYKVDKKGPPPWLVVVVVIGLIIFWTVFFIFYVTGSGSEYIG